MVLRRTAPPLLPLLLLLLWAAASVARGAILNDFIRHYEPVEYDASELHTQHRRVRRSTEYSPDVRLRFHASNRDFRLRLQPDRAVFSPDVVFESDSGPVKFDTNSVYRGVLEDDEKAVVHGVIGSDGLFDGTVVTASDHYYIEPSQRYFSKQQPFHSIVYRLSDVEHPEQPGRGCASHSLAEHNRTGSDVTVTSEEGEVDEWLGHEQLYENVTGSAAEAADGASSGADGASSGAEGGERRRRRAIVNNKKTTCTMYLQADHLFYDQFGSEEACIDAMIRHVQQANEIYKAIDFDTDGVQDNIGFMIKRVRVHKPSAVNDVDYRFPGNYGVEKFLEKFSEENYDSFCLAYMFTYRDFEGGTLGLAWTGDLNQAGGVCEKNGHYRGSKKSLNSGIISILNYGKRVPPAVSHVTFAHEVGHNFGSQHDPDNNKDCTPGGIDGNYIMYARATSGDKRNNNRFSPCSLRSINPVLRVKARSTHGCFVEPQAAICGNGVVEDGEECDCGWEEDCKEACCNPMSATPPTGRPPCQLRAGARCSPSQGPCCNDTCEFGYGQECRDNNGCRAKARCNGRSADCPPSIQKPDRTICAEGNVCFKGECSGSICLAYGLESCQCEPENGGNNTKSCELCCKRPGLDQPCISTFEWNTAPFKIPDQFSKPGTPCKQYTGYCDVFQMCREVDPIGPLATLKNLFLSDKSLSVVKEFMDRYWYMIVLCLVIIILSLIAVIRIFGKAPPKYHRRHRRRNSATKKRPRDVDVESPPLPDVTAGAEAAPPTTEPADTEQTASERGRPQLKRRVEDVRRAAAKARRAASHMALSSRASVASGVARVTRRGKRDPSRPSGDEQRKRRRKDQSKSRGHRRPRDQTKDGVKVISYSNIPAELGVTETKTEPRLTGPTAKSAEAAAVGDADKRKSLPAAVARRKPTASADAEKRRSLPKPPGSPQKPARQESPSKQRRSTADVPARDQERERGRRKTKDAEQSLARSSSQRQRSSKREEKKKRSRSISPTKRPARESRPTAKPVDDKADKKKRFGLKHVASADNVISDWLGRNAKKDAHKHKHGERNRKKPIVPTAPMHPNDQVLQWLRTASSEPSGVDVANGMVSPKPTRRVSLSSSQTSGSLQRAPGRPGFGRVTSCEETSLASRQQSASPARDTASSLGAASRRRGASQSELSGGSASRPAYNRSRSQPAPSEERLSFKAVPEAVYDLPRGASPERIYDLPSGATPERELPLEPPRPAEPTRPRPAEPTRPPPAMDRQMSVPAFQQQRAPRSGSPSRRPPERNVSVPAGLHNRSPGRQATGSDRPDRTSAPTGHQQKTRRTASPSRYSSSERPGSVPSSRRPNSTISHHSPDRPLPSPPTERQVAAPEEREVAAPQEAAEDTSDESFLAMRADQ